MTVKFISIAIQHAQDNIKRRLTQINTQRDSLFSNHAAGRINDSYLDEKLQALKEEEQMLKGKLNNTAHDTAQAIYDLKRVINLVSHLPEIYGGSQNDHKGLILNILFANVFLSGKTLEFPYTKPLDLIVQGQLCSIAYQKVEPLLTAEYKTEAINRAREIGIAKDFLNKIDIAVIVKTSLH